MALAAVLAISAASAAATARNTTSAALRHTQATAPVQLSDTEMAKVVAGSTSKIPGYAYILSNGKTVCRFKLGGNGTYEPNFPC
jgi:hypothetical protein